MNHRYLMKHISYHLHTFVRRYTNDFIHIESFCGRIPFHDRFTPDELISFFTSQHDLAFDSPTLLAFNRQLLYALIPAEDNYFVIGPVQSSDGLYLRYQTEKEPLDESWIQTVPVCSLKKLASDVLLAFNLYRDEPLDESALLTANCIRQETDARLKAHFSELVFEYMENGRRHNPYD